jgi:formamidopyrimidine-DNA glycosylase
MPELPEVETVKRGLARVLEARVIRQARIMRPDLRRPFPADFAERLTGRRIVALGRRAKYLTLSLDDGWVVLVHLGMSGRMIATGVDGTPEPAPLGPHDHVILECDDGGRIVFTDPRRFGLMDMVRQTELDRHPLLASLGPEPLEDAFTPAVLSAALAGKNTPIKAALLDQTVVAGLGNIYVSEALFRARIAPRRRAGTVAGKRAETLVPAIKTVLEDAIKAGGSTLRDHRQASGELGYFQHDFKVYDREGKPCPGCDCARGITRIVQSGRSTFYCAKRQR